MKRRLLAVVSYTIVIIFLFMTFYGDLLMSKEIDYSNFVDKLNNNEFSKIVVEANEYRAFGYSKDNDNIYMVKVASFEDLEREILQKTNEEFSLDYKVGKINRPSSLKFFFYVLGITFLFNLIVQALRKTFYKYTYKLASKKDLEKKDIEERVNKIRESLNDNCYIPKVITEIKTRFSDVIGLDDQIEELNDIVSFLKEPEKYEKVGAEIPKGVLLYGKPGTGKTLIARAIAGEAGVPFFSVSASQLQSKFLGSSEENIRKLFDSAQRRAPSIIFFDEIDSIAVKRYSDSSNKYAASILNQLLACMDGFEKSSGVIVIAATNHKEVLDDALLRRGRFDKQIYIHEPDKISRQKMIHFYMMNKKTCEADFDKKLADLMTGATGSDIKTVINEAAIFAVRNNRDYITLEDAYEAYRKTILGVKGSNIEITLKDKKITAVHEAGHAIVSMVLGKMPVEISIISRGSAGGYNLFKSEESTYFSKNDLLREVIISLGGRAAEKVIFGKISTGASSDLRNASDILFRMNLIYGMNLDAQLVLTDNEQYNANITNRAIKPMQAELSNSFEKAKRIIEDYRDMLEKLVNILLEKETLNDKEIEDFFQTVDL